MSVCQVKANLHSFNYSSAVPRVFVEEAEAHGSEANGIFLSGSGHRWLEVPIDCVPVSVCECVHAMTYVGFFYSSVFFHMSVFLCFCVSASIIQFLCSVLCVYMYM